MKEQLQNYRKFGKEFSDNLKLTTYPIAIKLVKEGDKISPNALSPRAVFGYEIPPCVLYTWCRRGGFHFHIKGSDIACKPISIHHFGLEELSDPNEVFNAWERKARYKKDIEAEKESRKNDITLEYGEIKGIILSPLNSTIIVPDVVMIFCTPLIISHLILAATYNGGTITSHFNGMESSCKEGILRTYKTDQCQVVAPGMGDRVMAAVQDHEMIFGIPRSKLSQVLDNLFLAGKKITPSPFGIPHLNVTLGPVKTFEKYNEPGVWDYLRKRLKNDYKMK